jgi:gliding motility-associated-like protein
MRLPILMFRIFLFVAALLAVTNLRAGGIKSPKNETQIKFTENKKQWASPILYRAQLDGGVLFLEKNCFTYSFYNKEQLRKNHALSYKSAAYNLHQPIASHAFRMTFAGANKQPETSAKQQTHDYANYYIGKDETHWAGKVHHYREVNYSNLYHQIDLQIIGLQNSVKYNFIVGKGGNTNDIQLLYEGLDAISLEKGTLKIKTSLNEITEQKPFAYQWIGSKQVNVPCEFVLKNNTVSFYFPNGYNKGYELVIDPVLVFACSSGSTADNFGMTATYDAAGNLYSGGTCFNQGFPTTLGAYDVTYNGVTQSGRTDVVVTKYDSSGTFLQYSTYLGGATGTEIVTSLVVDASNNLYLYGATGSTDFPVTTSAYDLTFNGGEYMSFAANGTTFSGGTDIYVSKFNPMGTQLLASTYIGGNKNDGVNNNNDTVFIPNWGVWEYPLDSLQFNYGDQYRGEINVDNQGNVYIASSTRSSNFPTANAFDNTLGGQQDAVVFKMNNTLSQLLWCSFLGGSDNDAGYALALDDSLNVYVSGGTRSNNFPTTVGALNTTYRGGKADGYIAQIKNDGSQILIATYLGTNAYDQCYFVQLDKNSNVYVVGQTQGAMPVTAGVYNNANSGQFITKLNQSLSAIVFSTVFGNGNGQPNISPAAFLVDVCENIYVSGWGGNIITGASTFNMPITNNAIQPNTDGFNFYLFVLSTNATNLLYATYFGGGQSQEHVDGGTSRFDKKGIIYQSVCAGCGGSDDFPVTAGSWPNTGGNVNHAQNCNNGTFKFDFQVPLAQANFSLSTNSGCAPLTVNFTNQSTSGGSFLWNFGNNDTTSIVLNPIKVFPTPGTYTVQLLVVNPASCNVLDTALNVITVYPSITSDFDFAHLPCSNQFSFFDSSFVAPVSWLWNFGDNTAASALQNPSHTYSQSGIYNVQLIASTVNGCKDTSTFVVNNTSAFAVSLGTSICQNSSTNLLASGGFQYQWLPSSGLNNTTIANPIATPSVTTTYTVFITGVNAIGDTCTAALTTSVQVFSAANFPLVATADRDTLFQGESTILHAITDTTLDITWSPANTLSSATAFNPVAAPSVTTTYTLTLIDTSGCSKSVTYTVYVISKICNGETVFVPNTFTPNSDGRNDVLYVRSNTVTNLYFAVYDRWGELMFETTDLKKGWDGTFNGKACNPAVFAWYLKAKCANNEDIKLKGNVTLIR